MAKNEANRYVVRPLRIIIVFIVAFLIFEAIFYFTINNFNNGPINTSFFIYTPILVVTTTIFCIVSIKSTYYEIHGDKFVHHKMGKITEFKYKDILYVDEEWSKRHKMVLFYTNNGKSGVLAFDKDAKLYQTILEKAPLITWEEYKMRFPSAMK